MRAKRTVVFNVKLQIAYAVGIAEVIYRKYNKQCIVTSGNDSKHSKNSLHYKGLAVDLRSKHLDGYKQIIFNELSNILNPLGYDCVFEDKEGSNEHFHIEYDPKESEQWIHIVE